MIRKPLKNPQKKEIRDLERKIDRSTPDYAKFEKDISTYFKGRVDRLRIVKTTRTPSGQILDWVPIESQHPSGIIAHPPPESKRVISSKREKVHSARFELEDSAVERGPKGTVPILRKDLSKMHFTKSLKDYLSRDGQSRKLNIRKLSPPDPVDQGHRYSNTAQGITCFGGEGDLSCFDPYSGYFSLIQIGLINGSLGYPQTVEAGWQEYENLTGDWIPHLFLYYTTNGYSQDGNNLGGYNQDVDGWIQYDDALYPGATYTPYGTPGGDCYEIFIKFQLYQGNWWFKCQDRWLGYYPGSLFSALGDHADQIGFWGEIFNSQYDPNNPRVNTTTTDMCSGYWAEYDFPWCGYMHNLMVQIDQDGSLIDYDGGTGWASNPDSYDIITGNGGGWGSYILLGGPGVGWIAGG